MEKLYGISDLQWGVPRSFSATLLWPLLKCRPWLYTSYIALPHSLDFYILTVLLTSQLPLGKCSNKSNLQAPLKWLNSYKAKTCPRAGWPTSQSKGSYWRSPDVQKAFTSRQSDLCPVWAVSKLSQSGALQTQWHNWAGRERCSEGHGRVQRHLHSPILEPQVQRWSLEAA